MTGRIFTSDHHVYDLPEPIRWNVTHTGSVPCDSFEMTVLYQPDMAPVLRLAAGFACIQDGVTVLRGIVDEYTVQMDTAGITATLIGRGYAARLLDNESRPVTYQGATLEEIIRCHVRPYGISCGALMDLKANSAYTVAAGTSQWKALEDFCRTYGGFSPRFARDGKLIAVPETPGKTIVIGDSDPVLGCTLREDHYGVLPVENSSSGSINLVYDLMGKYACHIVGEQLVRVEHCLLGVPGTKVEDIKTVYSHEQGFAQCPVFLGEHPEWTTTPYFNTAIAAKHVAELGDTHNAAIASRLAAKHYGLEIVVPDIHSFDGNHTRFIVVSASPMPIGVPDKATITFAVRHERGSLMRALSSFVAMGMNLTHIESRPLHDSNWEYCFYVDLAGNIDENTLRILMDSLSKDCENCRLLGAYKAARE